MVFRVIKSFFLTLVVTVANEVSLESSCRSAGFDPYQLACSTCELLPEAHLEKCKSCCLSYKTLEKKTQRYNAAVVTHAPAIPGYFTEITGMIKEDWEDLVGQKGPNSLIFRDTSDAPQTPSIFWFQELPPNVESMDIHELEELAPKTEVLIGWKRDDVREMLKAIIPDQ